MTDHGADLLIRAAAVHTQVPGQRPQRALAVRGDRVIALSDDPHGLDELVTVRTAVRDLPGATVLPAFDDTHTHMIFAAHSARDVPVHQAHTIAEFLDLIRQRAAVTPEGEWIRTTTNWQELNLAERRMPTADELDQATDRHPVLVKRGGHNDVVNNYALAPGGYHREHPGPAGGVIGRDENGRLNGRLIDNALGLVERFMPAGTGPSASTGSASPELSTLRRASAPFGTAPCHPRRLRDAAGRTRRERSLDPRPCADLGARPVQRGVRSRTCSTPWRTCAMPRTRGWASGA